jgi:hypothetical protein
MKCTQQNGYYSLPSIVLIMRDTIASSTICVLCVVYDRTWHHSIHIHIIHSHYPSWGLIVDKVWIFLARGISMVLCRPFVLKLEVHIM